MLATKIVFQYTSGCGYSFSETTDEVYLLG